MTISILLIIVALGLGFYAGLRVGRQQITVTDTVPITFEIDIPADTPPGDVIYLTGTFNSWNPADPQYKLTPMADKVMGTWAFSTTHVLEYKVTRGAWESVEKGPGGSELTNHVLTPSATGTVKLTVAEWADRATDDQKIYDERVERVLFHSEALGIKRTVYVYLPPEARTDEAALFPTLYLLRGHEREWINKSEDQTRGGASNVIDVYEDLRASGAIGPMVLVFPGMTSTNGAIHSLGINMRAPELAKDPSIGSGRFEDFFFDDLIPMIEARYPVLRGGEYRAVDGFSLGGFMSVNLALVRPNSFTSVGAYDGLYFWDEPRTGTTIAVTDTVFTRSLFDPNFGIPRDRHYAAEHNPLTLLRTDGQIVPELQWLIEFGPQHAEPNVNYFRGERLIELLEERGGVNQLAGPLPDGLHTWHMADEHVRRTFPLHWKRIQP